MMRGAGGALAVAVAALLVCCSADPHQDQDVSGTDHNSAERYDANEFKQKEDFEDYIRFLMQYENSFADRNGLNGLGGHSMLGRNTNTNGLGGSSLLGRNLGNLGGSSLIGRELRFGGQGRNTHGLGGSTLLGRSTLNGIGGSTLLGRNIEESKRFVDSLGGSNFVRNLDSIGGGNFVRNLDSIGGSNFVKKNLDQLGGPNLVKRNLDSLGGGNFVRNLDSIGGGNFVREIRHTGYMPYLISRRFDYASPYGGKREPWPVAPIEYAGYYGDGLPKRNFDEIDRSGLDTFVKKRNFDEIDRSSMPFPFATKRFYHLYGTNYLDLDTPVSSLDKKRYRQDYPMDEIDLSHLPLGSKRSQDSYPLVPRNLF
ncbi:orcokinin peptides-like [Trichoplusia ni]|uniref:Orcokinin peptides-like n=1 Tax=Trichoplusia ni TaxID=7111 RepID=A0A7E5W332_TRINI|nr:orcokinin peptides-like [Trichoplusia ni]